MLRGYKFNPQGNGYGMKNFMPMSCLSDESCSDYFNKHQVQRLILRSQLPRFTAGLLSFMLLVPLATSHRRKNLGQVPSPMRLWQPHPPLLPQHRALSLPLA
eukprot:5538368-Amphidinium_carterae.2